MRNKNKGPPARVRGNGAGVIIGIIALILAVSGSAVAAKGGAGLTAKQKKEVKAIAKSFQGTGPAGKDGANGTNGLPGAPGAKGANGLPGKDGKDGTDGNSVLVTAATALECDELGGAIVEEEGIPSSAVEVCTGEEGKDGKEGSPWTLNGTLPKGATLTGVWAYNASLDKFTTEVESVKTEVTVGDTNGVRVPISFPIRLSAALAATNVHFQSQANFTDFDEGGAETIGCTGTNALPLAPEGHLCVYAIGGGALPNATFTDIKRTGGGAIGSGVAGAAMRVDLTGGVSTTSGTWAVTGF